MLEKIKKYQDHPFFQQFRDIRFMGFVVFGILVLLVSWSGVSVIETNYTLQKQVSELEQQNQVAQLQNNNLKLQNEYYNSNQYLELTARRQFGKGQPGEKLLLVPASVALKYTVDIPEATKEAEATPSLTKPLYQRNLEAWVNFFTHRGSLDQASN
jgi:cell division protein FtsB